MRDDQIEGDWVSMRKTMDLEDKKPAVGSPASASKIHEWDYAGMRLRLARVVAVPVDHYVLETRGEDVFGDACWRVVTKWPTDHRGQRGEDMARVALADAVTQLVARAGAAENGQS